ncbi:MAG: NAD-dependent epimerase/dehydratase family protein [Armatimonadota bacterium]
MPDNMHCLVTGGAGFIGSNLASHLLTHGHAVRILDNLSSGYRQNLASLNGVEFLEGDVRDPDVVERAVRGVEVVFHLAASVGNKRSLDHPLEDSGINLLGTLQVLEAARRNKVRKIVVSSSAGIFGELKTLPIAEDHPLEPETPYGVSKLAEEKMALAYAKLYDIEAVALRYFNVYGPHQRFDAYGNVIPVFAFQMLRGEPLTIFGDGEQTRDFVNVGDVVQANLKAAAARGVCGAFNVGSGTRVSINRLVAMMNEASGLASHVAYAPTRPGDVRDSLAEIGAARRAFGYDPSVSMKQGLAAYFGWARTEVCCR